MSDSVQTARDRLISANAFVTIAMEPRAPRDVRRSAVRRLAKAIRQFVENEDVRDALLGMSDIVLAPGFVTAPELVQAVADMLTEEHARLLVVTGYRTPPPPPAHKLLDDTRRAVISAPSSQNYGVAHIETMYAALRHFLSELDSHSTASQSRLQNMLSAGRRVGVGALLVTTIYNTEFKLGDSFDVDATFSGKDKVKIEVTLPDRWEPKEVSQLLAIGAASALYDTVIQADLMQTSIPSVTRHLISGPRAVEDKQHSPTQSNGTAQLTLEPKMLMLAGAEPEEDEIDAAREDRRRAAAADDYQKYDSARRPNV